MITAICVHKFRDKNNVIFGYRLQDASGMTTDVKADALKQAIRNKQLEVTNLTLTSSGRLVNKKAEPLKNKFTCKDAPVNQIVQVAQKLFSKTGFQLDNNKTSELDYEMAVSCEENKSWYQMEVCVFNKGRGIQAELSLWGNDFATNYTFGIEDKCELNKFVSYVNAIRSAESKVKAINKEEASENTIRTITNSYADMYCNLGNSELYESEEISLDFAPFKAAGREKQFAKCFIRTIESRLNKDLVSAKKINRELTELYDSSNRRYGFILSLYAYTLDKIKTQLNSGNYDEIEIYSDISDKIINKLGIREEIERILAKLNK